MCSLVDDAQIILIQYENVYECREEEFLSISRENGPELSLDKMVGVTKA